MKYNIGDRVRIKTLDWYNENRNDDWGSIELPNGNFYPSMAKYCGEVLTIIGIKNGIYLTKEGDSFNWTDEMIEGLVEEEVFIKANDIYNEEYSKGEYCHEQSFKWGFQEGYNYSHENDKLEISLKEGYIFKDENGNVIDATKIVLEKKKKEYPKTYEECCKILGLNSEIIDSELLFYYPLKCGDYTTIRLPEMEKFEKFIQLYLCRNAYWKIAGEEIGLGKPWEPDWSIYEHKFCLGTDKDKVIEERVTTGNRILAFPTPEMRDAFYENFKSEIESCKELL